MLGHQFIIYTFLFILKINKISGISETDYFYEGCVSVADGRKVTFDTVEAYQRNDVSFKYGDPNFRGDLVDFDIMTINVLYNNTFENTYDTWVRGLFLQHKAIYEIQDGAFHSLICLRTLVLSKNLIKTLRPKMFKGLSMLFELDISENMITSLLNDTFDYVPHLHELDLGHNLIQFIELNTFNKLKLLHALHLGNNKLNVVELDIFKDAMLLKVLDLRYCNMTELKIVSNSRSVLPHLQIFDISHNKLHSGIPNVGFPALLELHLDFNHLRHLNVRILLQNCPQLRRLFIGNNDIQCKEMEKIQTELISYNVALTKIVKCPTPENLAENILIVASASVTLSVVVITILMFCVLIYKYYSRRYRINPGPRVAGYPQIIQPAQAVEALQPAEAAEQIPEMQPLLPLQLVQQVDLIRHVGQIQRVQQVPRARSPIRLEASAV